MNTIRRNNFLCNMNSTWILLHKARGNEIELTNLPVVLVSTLRRFWSYLIRYTTDHVVEVGVHEGGASIQLCSLEKLCYHFFLACSCHSPIPIGLLGLLSSTPRPKLRKPTFTVASKHTYTTLSSFVHPLAFSRSTPPLANTPTATIIVALNKDHSIVYLLVLP